MARSVMIVVVTCMLATSAWASALTEAPGSPLIQQGTVEVSTLGPFMGGNLLGLGAGIFKAEDDWFGTLGLSIGYFAMSYAEIEGSFGLMRSWGENWSETIIMTVGKLVLNYVSPGLSAVPYAFGGIGLMSSSYSYSYMGYSDSSSDSESLFVFGGGLKLPVKLLKRAAVRIEYSYNKSAEEKDAPALHAVSLGFSVFLRDNP